MKGVVGITMTIEEYLEEADRQDQVEFEERLERALDNRMLMLKLRRKMRGFEMAGV